jgi:hypothetical protein
MRKIFLISFLFLLLAANQVQAALVPCGPGTGKDCQFCDFFVLINNILAFAFEVIAFIVVVMAIVGGVFFFFAGANPDALRRAKGIITSVVIGIVIILAAWAIVNTIFEYSGIIKMQGWQWWNIQCTY